MNAQSKIRTHDDANRFRLALAPVDTAMWESEQRWGVGRLERLQSPEVLASYARGWAAYRQAIESSDGPAVEAIGPKMLAALAFMATAAEQAGHKPLDPSTWEASLPDGRVLVVCRTEAEATAVQRASNGRRFTADPIGSMAIETASTETTLPPDLAVTIRNQHEGRRLEVWTLAAIVRLVVKLGLMVPAEPSEGVAWEGSPAVSGVAGAEGDAADIVRGGFPLDEALTEPARVPVLLDF